MTIKDYIRQLKLAHDPYIVISGAWGSGILNGLFSALSRPDEDFTDLEFKEVQPVLSRRIKENVFDPIRSPYAVLWFRIDPDCFEEWLRRTKGISRHHSEIGK